jgi:hypothetical protein
MGLGMVDAAVIEKRQGGLGGNYKLIKNVE